MTENNLPYSFEFETSVLGSILDTPSLIENCTLRPEMFYEARHQLIFEFMQYLVDAEKPIDLVTIARVAGENIHKIGGISYLGDLQSAVPSVSNFKTYELEVRDLFNTREIMRTLHERLVAGNSHANPTKYLLETLSALEGLTGGQTESAGMKRLGDSVPEHREQVHKRKEKKGLTGAKSCSEELNKMTGGFQDGDFIVTAARPSMGRLCPVW